MKPFLRLQLERYPVRLQELDFFLQQPEMAQDMERLRALTREHAEVSEVAALYARFRQREADLAGAQEMMNDPQMAEMAREEIAAADAATAVSIGIQNPSYRYAISLPAAMSRRNGSSTNSSPSPM